MCAVRPTERLFFQCQPLAKTGTLIENARQIDRDEFFRAPDKGPQQALSSRPAKYLREGQ